MKPIVHIISRPTFDIDNFIFFLESHQTEWKRTPNATCSEEIIEIAGRICYMSFGNKQSPKTNSDYIQHLIEMGHESVLEHVNWTFLITQVTRAFTHQLVRHRAGFSFSQLSQQYHDETNAQFIPPVQIDNKQEIKDMWYETIEQIRTLYQKLLHIGQNENINGENNLNKKEYLRSIRSAARSILPNATETYIVVTANARALRHFLKVRGSIPGDLEMRLVCTELLQLLKKESPSIFNDFQSYQYDDNYPIVIHGRD